MSSQSEQEAKANLVRKANLFRQILGTPGGARVMSMLKEEFCPPAEVVLEMSDAQMRASIAQKDVIEYIQRLLEFDRV